jgi:hypothetical protein
MADSSRRARLNAVKLGALVRDHLGETEAAVEQAPFPGGAALRIGDTAWVLADEAPHKVLGGALAWALRSGAERLCLVAEASTGLLARRAAGLTFPVEVFHADGRVLLPAVDEPLAPESAVLDEHRAFESVIVDAGAEVVHEHGVVAGEVDGLEVCRVVDDPALDVTRLEVGVGAHDREAFLMLHGGRPTAEALAEVVTVVRGHRRGDVQGHPLSRLAGERLLRARLIAEPELIGASAVRAVSPPVPRTSLKDATPCAAVATIDGDEVAVVCSVGVDLDAVPFLVDVVAATGLASAVLVVPPRDAIPLQHRLAELVRQPVRIVTVPVA